MTTEKNFSFLIGNTKFSSPIFLAFGPIGYGYELENIIDYEKIGAIITKGISLNARENVWRWDTTKPLEIKINGVNVGFLNLIPQENVGANEFARSIMPKLKKLPTKIIVNIFGENEEEYKKVIEILEESENSPDGYEINFSNLNTKKSDLEVKLDEKVIEKIINLTRKSTKRPIIVKFPPVLHVLSELIKVGKDQGADAFTLTSTIPIAVRDPKAGFFKGQLSGHLLKLLSLRCVIETLENFPEVKIIGSGGVYSIEDVLDYITAGAVAVQVATATIKDPKAAQKLSEELEKGLKG